MMIGSVVRMDGVVRGMDREAHCDVLVRKGDPGTGSDYSDGFVLNAPADLPDGEYFVKFDGHAFVAKKEQGVWHHSTAILRLIPGFE